MMNQIIYTQL